MIGSLQPALDMRNPDGTRLTFQLPLLGVEGVRAATGLDEDEILAEIEEGRILWAWNIGLEGERTYLRVWHRSLAAWHNPKLAQPEALDEVLRAMLPTRCWITGTLDSKEVKRVLNTGHMHVARLCETGLLSEHAKSGERAASGPNGKRIITRASVERFFRERRMI
jgi:hypothetical protein